MARLLDNFYLLVTESTVKLTYVRSVPGEGEVYAVRDESRGKNSCNIRRAKSAFLDLGQSNPWQYMGTFTAAAENPEADIKHFQKWLKALNFNHGWHIAYLLIFELGEKGKRLHAHTLLNNVPAEFVREYTKQEYQQLPRDVKRLYSQYKTADGTRLACCPWWSYGWSTLVPVDGSPKIVSYMTKYLTKGSVEFTTRFGGHAYFGSKGLHRPEKQKIPACAAGTALARIPDNAWHSEFVHDGRLVSQCFVMDKDKLSTDLWQYYNRLFKSLQDGTLTL